MRLVVAFQPTHLKHHHYSSTKSIPICSQYKLLYAGNVGLLLVRTKLCSKELTLSATLFSTMHAHLFTVNKKQNSRNSRLLVFTTQNRTVTTLELFLSHFAAILGATILLSFTTSNIKFIVLTFENGSRKAENLSILKFNTAWKYNYVIYHYYSVGTFLQVLCLNYFTSRSVCFDAMISWSFHYTYPTR